MALDGRSTTQVQRRVLPRLSMMKLLKTSKWLTFDLLRPLAVHLGDSIVLLFQSLHTAR